MPLDAVESSEISMPVPWVRSASIQSWTLTSQPMRDDDADAHAPWRGRERRTPTERASRLILELVRPLYRARPGASATARHRPRVQGVPPLPVSHALSGADTPEATGRCASHRTWPRRPDGVPADLPWRAGATSGITVLVEDQPESVQAVPVSRLPVRPPAPTSSTFAGRVMAQRLVSQSSATPS
jgi:hypothetical protein